MNRTSFADAATIGSSITFSGYVFGTSTQLDFIDSASDAPIPNPNADGTFQVLDASGSFAPALTFPPQIGAIRDFREGNLPGIITQAGPVLDGSNNPAFYLPDFLRLNVPGLVDFTFRLETAKRTVVIDPNSDPFDPIISQMSSTLTGTLTNLLNNEVQAAVGTFTPNIPPNVRLSQFTITDFFGPTPFDGSLQIVSAPTGQPGTPGQPGAPGEPGTVTITDPNTGTFLQQLFDTVFRFSVTGGATPSSQELQVVFGNGTTQSILTTLGDASGLPDGIDSILNNLQSGLISVSPANGNVMMFQLRQLETGVITPLTIGQVTANGFTLTGGGFNIAAEVLGSPADTDTVQIFTKKIEVNGEQLEAISLNNLDTSTVTGERITVQVDATLYREAAFDNLVGFYLAERTTGAVVNGLTGNSVGLDDRNAYLEAVRDNAVLTGRVANNQTTDLSRTFKVSSSLNLSDYVLLPFLVANGDLESVISDDFSNLFVAGIGTNVSNSNQIRLLGNNVFGFEDIAGGGDFDFDDVIFQVRGIGVLV